MNPSKQEIKFIEFFKDFIKDNGEKFQLTDAAGQIQFYVEDNSKAKYKVITYDLALLQDKKIKYLVEIDDTTHVHQNFPNKREDTDQIKDKFAKENGFKLLRIKSPCYVCSQTVLSDNDAYTPDFIKPYGKKLLTQHIKEFIQYAEKLENGCVEYCPASDEQDHYQKEVIGLFSYNKTTTKDKLTFSLVSDFDN